MSTALLLIDLQNDYFPDGNFPLCNTAPVLEAAQAAAIAARKRGVPIILVQHVSANPQAKFFRAGTRGAEIHPRILAAAPGASVVVKQFADSFHRTELESTLQTLRIEHLLVGGMMSQNCVTHTVLSPHAGKYRKTVLADCTTTLDETVHAFALDALSAHFPVVASTQALSA